ncbi:MAG: hypothetical protein QXH44_10060 [Pyrobaculum sp.]
MARAYRLIKRSGERAVLLHSGAGGAGRPAVGRGGLYIRRDAEGYLRGEYSRGEKACSPPPGYAAIQAGLAYILAPEGAEVDAEKTLALNALAHAVATDVRRCVERRVAASGCLRLHGSHPYLEHWLYSRE